MQLTTLFSATFVAFCGFAAAAPANIIPTEALSERAAFIIDDYKHISSGPGQTNGENDDASRSSRSLDKREGADWVRRVRYCEDAYAGGTCINKDFRLQTGCYNLAGWWNDRISSIYLPPRTYCALYEKSNCRGKTLKMWDPGFSNLKEHNFNDKASSMTCGARPV